MLDAIMEYTSTSHLPTIFQNNKMKDTAKAPYTELPQRMEGNKLYRYSKVLEADHLADFQPRALPMCQHLMWAQPVPLNISAPTNFYQSQKLLSLSEEVPMPVVGVENYSKGKSCNVCFVYVNFFLILTQVFIIIPHNYTINSFFICVRHC